MRRLDAREAAERAVSHLSAPELQGFWIHVDDEPTDSWYQRPEAPDIDPRAASRVWEDP